jgi:hypothetical protein
VSGGEAGAEFQRGAQRGVATREKQRRSTTTYGAARMMPRRRGEDDALRGLLDEGDQGELQTGFRERRPWPKRKTRETSGGGRQEEG